MGLKKLIIIQKEVCIGGGNSKLRIDGKLTCGSGKLIKKRIMCCPVRTGGSSTAGLPTLQVLHEE
jgi:hypothetical protein